MFDNDIRSHECWVIDVSTAGAKLTADVELPTGSKFKLSTVAHGLARKECEVVWQKRRTIGVKFVLPDQIEAPAASVDHATLATTAA